MNKTQKLLLKVILKDEDANRFLFDKKDIQHGDKNKIDILFAHVKTELQIEHMSGTFFK